MEPDHDTIAAFISTNSEAVNDLFVQILLQCQELDLITGEMFAIDGCKLPSNKQYALRALFAPSVFEKPQSPTAFFIRWAGTSHA